MIALKTPDNSGVVSLTSLTGMNKSLMETSGASFDLRGRMTFDPQDIGDFFYPLTIYGVTSHNPLARM